MGSINDVWLLLMEYLNVSDIFRLSRALNIRMREWDAECVGNVRRILKVPKTKTLLQFVTNFKGRCRECGCKHQTRSFAVCRGCYSNDRSYYRLLTRQEIRGQLTTAKWSSHRLYMLCRSLPHVKRTARGGAFLYHRHAVLQLMNQVE